MSCYQPHPQGCTCSQCQVIVPVPNPVQGPSGVPGNPGGFGPLGPTQQGPQGPVGPDSQVFGPLGPTGNSPQGPQGPQSATQSYGYFYTLTPQVLNPGTSITLDQVGAVNSTDIVPDVVPYQFVLSFPGIYSIEYKWANLDNETEFSVQSGNPVPVNIIPGSTYYANTIGMIGSLLQQDIVVSSGTTIHQITDATQSIIALVFQGPNPTILENTGGGIVAALRIEKIG